MEAPEPEDFRKALDRLISERYMDERGGGKYALELLLAHYLSSHRSVHLLTRMEGKNEWKLIRAEWRRAQPSDFL